MLRRDSVSSCLFSWSRFVSPGAYSQRRLEIAVLRIRARFGSETFPPFPPLRRHHGIDTFPCVPCWMLCLVLQPRSSLACHALSLAVLGLLHQHTSSTPTLHLIQVVCCLEALGALWENLLHPNARCSISSKLHARCTPNRLRVSSCSSLARALGAQALVLPHATHPSPTPAPRLPQTRM